jgi:hypothetical protein
MLPDIMSCGIDLEVSELESLLETGDESQPPGTCAGWALSPAFPLTALIYMLSASSCVKYLDSAMSSSGDGDGDGNESNC